MYHSHLGPGTPGCWVARALPGLHVFLDVRHPLHGLARAVESQDRKMEASNN